AVARRFEPPFQHSAEFLAREAGRDRVQYLDDDRTWMTDKLAARPVEARVQRKRIAGQAQALVEGDIARLVVGCSTRRAARALGKNKDLAAFRCALLGIGDELLQRGAGAIAADEDVLELEAEPAVEG